MSGAVLAVAHRTNTVAKAESFVGHGFTHFELDVRLADDAVVLSHYQTVVGTGARLERDNGRVRYRSGPPFDAPLADVLAALPLDAVLVLDPKDRTPELRARVAAVLARTLPEPTRHIVSSRRITDLQTFAEHGFQTWHTLDNARDIRRFCARPDAAGVTVRQRALTRDLAQALHESTDTVIAWTVNSVGRARELSAAGVDGITTDRPAVRAALLQTS